MTFVVILHYPLKSLCKLQIRKGSREGGKIRSWWGKQWNTKGGRIFGKNWDTWSIILGENSAEHCFELRDLVPASFLKNPYLSYLPYFPYLFLNGTSWFPHKENHEEGAWSIYCDDFENCEWENFLSNQQIYGIYG